MVYRDRLSEEARRKRDAERLRARLGIGGMILSVMVAVFVYLTPLGRWIIDYGGDDLRAETYWGCAVAFALCFLLYRIATRLRV